MIYRKLGRFPRVDWLTIGVGIVITKMCYHLKYTMPLYLIILLEHVYINGLILYKIFAMKLFMYGYPKI